MSSRKSPTKPVAGSSSKQKKVSVGSKSRAKLLAEQQKLAAEAHKAEEAEQQRQQAQSLKLAALAAEEDRIKQLQKQVEELRLAEELDSDAPYVESRNLNLVELEEKLAAERAWRDYLSCNPLPDINSEAQLNTYISLWRGDNSSQDSSSPPIHTIFSNVLESCATTESVINLLQLAHAEARQDLNMAQQATCEAYIAQLREITVQKIDFITAEFVSRADEYQNHESFSMQCDHSTNRGLEYGLWVHNSAKHGRIKKIEWNTINTQVDLPVALQKTRTAIRIIRTSYDSTLPLQSLASNSAPAAVSQSNLHFVALGGLISIDQCALPPPPKNAKGWLMREISNLNRNIQIIPYPAQSSGPEEPNSVQSSATQAPLRVSFTLPANIFLDDREPNFGWKDSRNSCWRQEGIQLISFDSNTNRVVLSLANLRPFAVIQPRALDFPYREWSLVPRINQDNQKTNVLRLLGSRFPVELELTQGKLRLLQPQAPAFVQFNTNYYNPGELLLNLARLGLNIAPTTEDAIYCRKPVKSAQLLAALHEHLALVAPLFTISNCEYNSSRGRGTALFKLTLCAEGSAAHIMAGARKKHRELEDTKNKLKRQREERLEKERKVAEEEEKRRKAAERAAKEAEEESADFEQSLQITAAANNNNTNNNSNNTSNNNGSEEVKLESAAEDRNVYSSGYSLSQLKSQRISKSADSLTILVTLTHLDRSKPENLPQTQPQSNELVVSGNHASLEGPAAMKTPQNQAEKLPGGQDLLTFTIVRGNSSEGLIDLSALPGCSSHISLRRALFEFYSIIYDEVGPVGVALDMDSNIENELIFFPQTQQQLQDQQTVRRTLNLTNPFTFH
jgi:TolA-binding protein